jgi:rhamnosyltransferase
MAVIVCFHPDNAHLRLLVDALLHQLDTVYVIDNTPDAARGVLLPEHSRVLVTRLGKNVGIALGFNIGIRLAIEAAADYVLLSDQDSLPAEGMVHSLMQTASRLQAEGHPVCAVGPDFFNDVDERSYRFEAIRSAWPFYRRVRPDENNHVLEVVSVISSGALLSVQALSKVGLMLEPLFIDFVDIEWCERARSAGFRCYADGKASMKHAMGEASLRIWLFGWRQIARYGPVRVRYQGRNAAFLMTCGYVDIRLKVGLAWFLLGKLYAYAVFGDDRRRLVLALLGGVWDGLRRRLGSY